MLVPAQYRLRKYNGTRAGSDAMRRFRDEGKIRFIGLSDWDARKIMKFIERVDPDVVQPFRNIIDDEYDSSGLKAWVDAHDLGVAFFSPLKHGLLTGKYDEPQSFPEGDFRSTIAEFRDPYACELDALAAGRPRFGREDAVGQARALDALHAAAGG